MPKRSLYWLPEEQKLLRELKEEQITKNEKNWKIIAQNINDNFQTNKTPKQCRERYINHLKLNNNPVLNIEWNQQELNLLFQLYLNYGSKWAKISSFFQNKYFSFQKRPQNSIKNKFNNGLKDVAKNIQEYMASSKEPRRKKMTSQMLTILIDLSNKIRKLAASLSLTINEDSMIFRFQKKILKLSLNNEQFTNQSLQELIKLIRMINSKLRCFGVFKVSNRRDWKISENILHAICQFDRVVNEQFQPDLTKLTTQIQSKQIAQSDALKQQQSFSKFQTFSNVRQLEPLISEISISYVTGSHGMHNIYRDEYLFDF